MGLSGPLPDTLVVQMNGVPVSAAFANLTTHPPIINSLDTDSVVQPGQSGIISGAPPPRAVRRPPVGGGATRCNARMQPVPQAARLPCSAQLHLFLAVTKGCPAALRTDAASLDIASVGSDPAGLRPCAA